MKTIKVKALRNMFIDGEYKKAGSIFTVDDALGTNLIAIGKCVKYKAPDTKKRKVKNA